MKINPDDPRPPYLQAANQLRAAILTRRYSPGEQLPSQHELSEMFEVSRMTIQQALRVLHGEGLTISRQGSGVFVRERIGRPVGLRPHIEQAFEDADVTIDFIGYTSETLHGIAQEPLDRVREGRLTPRSITIRMILMDVSGPVGMPRLVDHDDEAAAALKARMAKLADRHASALSDTLHELSDLKLVPTVNIETRMLPGAPLVKCYIINRADLFLGFYPVIEHEIALAGQKHAVLDPMGKDAVMFHHQADGDPDSNGTQYVQQTSVWFDSLWRAAQQVHP